MQLTSYASPSEDGNISDVYDTEEKEEDDSQAILFVVMRLYMYHRESLRISVFLTTSSFRLARIHSTSA